MVMTPAPAPSAEVEEVDTGTMEAEEELAGAGVEAVEEGAWCTEGVGEEEGREEAR